MTYDTFDELFAALPDITPGTPILIVSHNDDGPDWVAIGNSTTSIDIEHGPRAIRLARDGPSGASVPLLVCNEQSFIGAMSIEGTRLVTR